MAAYFIRLAGCNVGCGFCDEKSAWNKDNSKLMTVEEIVNQVITSRAENIVMTGGEPTMYDLTELTQCLCKQGIKTYLETSGTNVITGTWNWITLSPKQSKLPLEESLHMADEIKVVIANRQDFLFAEQICHKVVQYGTDAGQPQADKHINKCFYLQPEYFRQATILPEIIEYIKQNPVWRLSLQTHKMINVK